MNRYFLLLLLLAAALGACRPVSSQTSRAASLGEEITLAVSDRAAFPAADLEVQFVAVIEDSRCPTDTTCVWAGEAKVQLAIRNNSEVTQHELVAGKGTAIGKHRVTVVQLRPEPVSTRKISPAEYRATLRVERS